MGKYIVKNPRGITVGVQIVGYQDGEFFEGDTIDTDALKIPAEVIANWLQIGTVGEVGDG